MLSSVYLTGPATDSLGVRCERLGAHDEHWVSEHTKRYWLAGWERIPVRLDRGEVSGPVSGLAVRAGD